jgi:tripartite-type tricarboxylate transporter receptor subunit TctC
MEVTGSFDLILGGTGFGNFREDSVRKLHDLIAAAVGAASLVAFASAGAAQGYPDHPITWVVPSSAGSGFDVVARIIAPKLSEVLGQSVVIQNIAGAGATIGAAVVAQAAPDGYTILLANSNHTAAESLYKKLSYNIVDSFDPVVRFVEFPQVLVVNPEVEAKTVADLLALAKAKPGELNIAHAGVGSTTFMCAELLKSVAGIDLASIPYAGGGPAMTSVVAGETNVYCPPYPAAEPFIKDGRIRALAITSQARAPQLPDLPAVSESLPGFEFISWYGLMVPAGTPAEVRSRIRAALVETLADPAVKKGIADLGFNPIDEGPEAFTAFLEKEVEVTRELIEKAGIEPQ